MKTLLGLAIIAALTPIGCGSAATPTPRPTATPVPAPPSPVQIELGSWEDAPPPIGFGGTITIYRDGVDGKIMMRRDFPDGSTHVQDLVQSTALPTRYDVVGTTEYYLVQGEGLGMYDEYGLIREVQR